MGYERYPRGNDRFGGNDRDQDQGRDYGSGRDYPVGERDGRDYYGGNRFEGQGGGNRFEGQYGRDQRYGREQGGYGRPGYGAQGDQYQSGRIDRDRDDYRGYRGGQDRDRAATSDRGGFDRGQSQHGRGFSGQPQGYDYEDRGFFNRAGDEVRSWFGDDEAERRREQDRRYDERFGNTGRSSHDEYYDGWRRKQLSELDRDYDEYRRENSQKFENEFGLFRTERQTQRSSLSRVREHMEVVGSDAGHVGTVDKVRGDRIILTKNDQDAGGRHHSIPSRWIEAVDDKVHIRKTADEAQAQWRDEEANQAFFGEHRDEHRASSTTATGSTATGNATDDGKPVDLNRSFSGTY